MNDQQMVAFDFDTPKCSRCGARVKEHMTYSGGWQWRDVRELRVGGSQNCLDAEGRALKGPWRISKRGNLVQDPLSHWVEEIERLEGGALT